MILKMVDSISEQEILTKWQEGKKDLLSTRLKKFYGKKQKVFKEKPVQKVVLVATGAIFTLLAIFHFIR